MPSYSIGPEPDAFNHFKDHLKSLLKFDLVRINELLELIQYNIIYGISAFIGGFTINAVFPDYKESVTIGRLAFEVIGELLALVLVVFYIRRLVKLVPFLLHINGSGFKPYLTTEYQGEIAIGIIFVGVQFRLIRKLSLLATKVSNAMFGDGSNITEVNKMQQTSSSANQ